MLNIDELMKTDAFALLASGMKDYDALLIVMALWIAQRNSGHLILTNFERFATDTLRKGN